MMLNTAVSTDRERILGKVGAAIIVLLWIVGVALATLWVGARSSAFVIGRTSVRLRI
jgi:hypothetical protein